MINVSDGSTASGESARTSATELLLAGRLRIPSATEALIFGLADVLINTHRDVAPRAQHGVLGILADAERRSLSIGVVADETTDAVRTFLHAARLDDSVDVIVGSDIDRTVPPGPSAYLEAARRLRVAPSNCVVIANSCAAVEAAARAGCYTIGVATGSDSFESLLGSPFTSDCVPDFSVRARLTALGFPARPVVEDLDVAESEDMRSSLDESRIRLDREDCPYPLSPRVAAELDAFVSAGSVRNAPGRAELCSSLASYCGVVEAQILPTNGARHGIGLILRALLRPGRTMLVAQPEYQYFGQVARWIGARILGVPYEKGLRFPYADFAAAAAQADLIVLINPNNPTGTGVEREFVEQLLQTHPSTPVVVDEAYYEFTGTTVTDLTVRYDNLIVIRTFSKAFAMPGLRLGYVVAHPSLVDELGGAPERHEVNDLAVAAGRAHLADIAASRVQWTETMRVVKPLVVGTLQEIGVHVTPGEANFALVEPRGGVVAVERLRQAGFLVRPCRRPVMEGMIRIAIGTYGEMVASLAVVQECLSDQGSR
ncbi:aminotransferase class I/II-fold pyridoxal phosphate-dependent enzyme [Nocardia vulneris]|uniref:aminotransferase class I/II-fold pyridoxal phosphate-dependent enzyme n=1 Tax=Nocardia vulneris TaxID=1141657 RepID=UPI0030D06C6C